MIATSVILASLELEPAGPNRYRAANAEVGHAVVFGGQLLAQTIVAASVGHDDKRVVTAHTVFARSASPTASVEIDVEPIHVGRSFASNIVRIVQGDRVCTTSVVLLAADEPDFIRHGAPAPDATPPARSEADGTWQVEVVGDVDIDDPGAVGPATLDVWTRFDGAPDDPVLGPALLAFATDGFLIGTAMRPHAGVGQALAHRSVSTGVVSHTLTLHEPVRADRWMLLSHRSPHAGHGRSYGRADVFTTHGDVTASFVQDAMIRPMGEGRGRL